MYCDAQNNRSLHSYRVRLTCTANLKKKNTKYIVFLRTINIQFCVYKVMSGRRMIYTAHKMDFKRKHCVHCKTLILITHKIKTNTTNKTNHSYIQGAFVYILDSERSEEYVIVLRRCLFSLFLIFLKEIYCIEKIDPMVKFEK